MNVWTWFVFLLLGLVAAPAAGASDSSVDAVLARHREAMGGERALQLLQQTKITWRTDQYQLVGTRTDYTSKGRWRSEERVPDLPYESVEVWDGQALVSRGTNGDVRRLGGIEVERRRTDLAIASLAYLRGGPDIQVELLPPSEDAGQRYDRLRVTPAGGIPVELWLDAAGLRRREIVLIEGTVNTMFIDEYARSEGVPMPKKLRATRSTEKDVATFVATRVEFPRSLPDSLFQAPRPVLDATFPPGSTSIILPLALWSERWVTVQARLGGHIGTFLLDTGASSTAYDFAFLKKIGAKPKGQIAPAGGLFKGISFVRTPALEFGELRFGPQTVLAIDLHAPDSSFPTQLDGILGYDFLSRFPVTIDYAGGWLTFWRPGSYQPLPQELALPIEFVGTEIRLPARINGEDAGTFLLDTGNGGYTSVQHVRLKRPLVPPEGRKIRYTYGQEYGTGSAAAFLAHGDLTVGKGEQSVTWKGAPLEVLDLDDPNAGSVGGQGNLGVSWLKHFRVTFDYDAAKLYLLQRRSFRPASLMGDYGVEARLIKGKLMVRDVAPGGPAAVAALQPGDELLEVDGVSLVIVNNSAPRLLSEPLPGEQHTLRVRRGEQVLTVQMTAVAIP